MAELVSMLTGWSAYHGSSVSILRLAGQHIAAPVSLLRVAGQHIAAPVF